MLQKKERVLKTKTKNIFCPIIRLLDVINLPVILLSLVALVLEFTNLRQTVSLANKILDIFFVCDFLIRLIAFTPKKYFFKQYGWVDFLACLPIFGTLASFTTHLPLLRFFKLLRIGRFFKIIRVLRFLKMLQFIKKMKSDSNFVHERIMKMGVVVVLVFVSGMFVFDTALKSHFTEQFKALYNAKYKLCEQDARALLQQDKNVIFAYQDGNVYVANGDARTISTITDKNEFSSIYNGIFYPVQIAFTNDFVYTEGMILTPKYGIVVDAPDLLARFNNLMLILLAILVVMLVVLLFFMGAVFAVDMRKVQLIVDSIDAGDYMLLAQEASKYAKDGSFVVDENADELDSLMCMMGKLINEQNLNTNANLDNLNFSLVDVHGAQDTAQIDEQIDEKFDEQNSLQEEIEELECVDEKIFENTNTNIEENLIEEKSDLDAIFDENEEQNDVNTDTAGAQTVPNDALTSPAFDALVQQNEQAAIFDSARLDENDFALAEDDFVDLNDTMHSALHESLDAKQDNSAIFTQSLVQNGNASFGAEVIPSVKKSVPLVSTPEELALLKTVQDDANAKTTLASNAPKASSTGLLATAMSQKLAQKDCGSSPQ